MKRFILLISLYILAFVGAMCFVQNNYNFNWKPATKSSSLEKPDKQRPQTIKQDFNFTLLEQQILPIDDPYPQKPKQEEMAQTYPEENITPDLENQELASEPNKAQRIEDASPEKTFEEQLKEKDLVDIETLPIKVFLDMRYATANNFTGKKLYKQAKCYLKKQTAAAIVKAATYALEEEEPFYLCIYDCYRPNSVQKIMLKSTDRKEFLAGVSNHSRGMAVDAGPCDEQGEPLLTPTEFDTFSELSAAYTYAEEIPQIAIENREALQRVMKKAGFSTISTEWWHFDYKNARKEEVLNITF